MNTSHRSSSASYPQVWECSGSEKPEEDDIFWQVWAQGSEYSRGQVRLSEISCYLGLEMREGRIKLWAYFRHCCECIQDYSLFNLVWRIMFISHIRESSPHPPHVWEWDRVQTKFYHIIFSWLSVSPDQQNKRTKSSSKLSDGTQLSRLGSPLITGHRK